MNGTIKVMIVAGFAFALLASGAALGQNGKLTLDYSVNSGGEKIGWSKAVIDETAKGKVVTITMKITAEIFGKLMTMSSSIKNRYDTQGRTTSFYSKHDNPKGTFEITGKRVAGGAYQVTSKNGKKSETTTVAASSFDYLSTDPAIYLGPLGKTKMKLLITTSGEVRKVSVDILDRKTQTVLGEKVTVTHFTVSGSKGSTEEWRADDGTLVKSSIKTPLGKLVVKLIPPKS